MKRIFTVFLMMVLILSLLCGCGSRSSEGLAFTSNGDGTCTWTGVGSCTDTEIIVPEIYNDETVVAVGSEVLGKNATVKKVVLPDSIKTIQEEAFAYNDELEEIKLGNSLETIGDYAIAYCENLKDIQFPKTIKTIGAGAFCEDTALTQIILPEGVESIGPYAFSRTSAVKVISIPETVMTVSAGMFDSTSLEEVKIAGDVLYFGVLTEWDDQSKTLVDYYGSLNRGQKEGGECKIADDKHLGEIVCAMFNKKELRVNGQVYSSCSALEPGMYKNEGASWEFEIVENENIRIFYGIGKMEQIGEMMLEYDQDAQQYKASGKVTMEGREEQLSLAFILLDSHLILTMEDANNDTYSSIWSK